jgi:hypothetical protein
MATRCFSPPLSLSPRSPTTVPHPCGIRPTARVSLAAAAAASTAARGAPGRP